MDEMWVVGVLVVTVLPIVISIIALVMQSKKDTKDEHREYVKATTELTASIVKLTDKIEVLVSDNEKQDQRLENHEGRIHSLEQDMAVVKTEMNHYHKKEE